MPFVGDGGAGGEVALNLVDKIERRVNVTYRQSRVFERKQRVKHIHMPRDKQNIMYDEKSYLQQMGPTCDDPDVVTTNWTGTSAQHNDGPTAEKPHPLKKLV